MAAPEKRSGLNGAIGRDPPGKVEKTPTPETGYHGNVGAKDN